MTMGAGDLEDLARRRHAAAIADEEAHRRFMDGLEEAIVAGAKVNLRGLAREAGIAHGTIYNELARRQERRDQLSSNGDVPAAAPHDDDRAAAAEPTVRISDAQRRLLEEVHREGYVHNLSGRHDRTIDALRNRGLLERESLDLTRAGRDLVERGGRA